MSTSNWHELYLTGRTTLHEQMGNRAAAYAISTVYFITFMILMVNIILNLVLAVFVDSWTQMTVISKRLKAKMKAKTGHPGAIMGHILAAKRPPERSKSTPGSPRLTRSLTRV